MKLRAVTLRNFRAYQEPTRVDFDDLTTIIGRNDIGKSSILEALEIFFNGDIVKMEPMDANARSGSQEVSVQVEFTDLPETLTLDAGATTTLQEEYLLASDGALVVEKVFDCSKSRCPSETYIIAQHPTAREVGNLLELKEKDLQNLVKSRGLSVPLKGNPGMRRAIWASEKDLELAEVRIAVSKPKEDSKQIWEQLQVHLPIYALFQSDRQSRDSDEEVQNPLKGAVATAIAEVQEEIERIQEKVKSKSVEIANLTHDALKKIDPKLASVLVPTFQPPTASKWTGLFSLGMETGDNIPLNKRGSGVRRLILVSFFKAEAERKLATSSKANIIYAVEEPETSQHPANQRILINAFKEIAAADNSQVILTTHSPGLAADLPVDSIRFVSAPAEAETPQVEKGADVFGAVAETLGLTPDSRVKVLLCVEGPTDVDAIGHLSRALHEIDPSIPNLRTDPRCAFILSGGSTLKHWVSAHYLKGLGCPEVHIYDSDIPSYGQYVARVNARTDGRNSWAALTAKHEIECYLHPDAIFDEFGVEVDVVDHPAAGRPSVPSAFALAYQGVRKWPQPMSDTKAKAYLSRAFAHMTAARLAERDPQGEVQDWFRKIAALF